MSKSIVEKALLEAEQLEETMRSNAKEILSSTMKEEIQELVKESLTEEDDYLKEQEGIEQEVDTEIEVSDDDVEADEMSVDMETEDELDLGDELDIEDETEDFESEELPPLDLTSASDEEVLKVFKAMGEEDGVVVTQDNGEIILDDGDEEYLIKLEENKKNMKNKKSNLNEMEDETMEMVDEPMENEDDMMEDDEVMYEIELDEDDVIGVDEPESASKLADYEKEGGDITEMEDEDEMMEDKEYGGNKGDESRSRRDYMERKKYGGNKGDESRSKRDYMEGQKYGGNKGDESRSRRDYMERGKYGGNKGDESRSRRDFEEGQKYGGNKGDESRSRRDYMERGKYGGNKGDESRSRRDFEEASRSYGFGAKKGRGLRKSFTDNRNLTLGEGKNMSRNYSLLKEEVQSLKSRNVEYKKALVTFKEKLNEVGVFNSNLAYATRLFTEHSTTKQEKINVLRRFDNVKTLKESKDLYKVVKEELSQTNSSTKSKKRNISEAVERKINSAPKKGSSTKLMETKVYENPQFSRIKDLMSKI
jgi:hypothetical protein